MKNAVLRYYGYCYMNLNKGAGIVKKLMLTLWFIGLMLVGTSFAQDDTTTTTTSGESSVFFFHTPCEAQAVFDLNGFAASGIDIYLQVFDQVGGAGNPLTDLIRVSVDGDYQVSQVLPYNNGQTLLLGQFSSAVISLASENDPSNIILTFTDDEVLGNCSEPSFPLADSVGSSSTGTSTPLVDPVTGNIIGTGEVISTSGIFTPDGGTLNEVFSAPQEAIVQIGARPSDITNQNYVGRVSDPGLIFAECDAFPATDPGIVWDVDTVTVFWSWFAATPAQAQDHINNAQYEVFLSSQYAHRQPFPNVVVSPITKREDGNYYVFYSANLGTGFRSGDYRVDYYVTWDNTIDDGYSLFGPNTETPFILNTCSFTVQNNPFGVETQQNNPTVPLQQ